MIFNRPPRIINQPVAVEVKISLPPALPSKPKINWLLLLLPVLVSGLLIVGMAYLLNSSSGTSYFMFLPLMFVGVIVSVVGYFQQKKEYQVVTEQKIKKFKLYLDKQETEIIEILKKNQEILLVNDPSPADCVRIATEEPLNARLGERRPTDDDFLVVRIGLGEEQSLVKVVIPENINDFDDLLSDAASQLNRLGGEYISIKNTPVTVPLMQFGSLGVFGPVSQAHNFIRGLLVSLTTHHWISEVNVVVFCRSGETSPWKWFFSIPHKPKFLPKAVIELEKDEIKNLSVLALEKEIRRREAFSQLSGSQNSSSTKQYLANLPVIVCILDRIQHTYDYAAFSLILEKGIRLGIYPIILQEDFNSLSGECEAVVEIQGNRGFIKAHDPAISPKEFILDEISISASEALAKALERVEWLVPNNITDPPSHLNLCDFFDSKICDLPLEKWWDEEPPYGFLKAPIGKFSPTADLIFDLTESGHGPHGIIAGTTGSGKSETLRTIILSLAMLHNPYDLNFALIDFKGGAAFQGLDELPHVVGLITDIENNVDYASRVIQSLSGEIKTRKQVLSLAQDRSGLFRAHVDDYRSLPIKRPLPHLVIIFDEFAEFKQQYPKESEQLVSIARVGRSLGIHLILCAQSPSIIEGQIQQNAKFRICLPVSSPEDSVGFIRVPDAANLSVGEAFFLVKKPQKFRVAYTGNYQFEDFLPDNAIVKTNHDGRREVIYPPEYHQFLPKAKTEGSAIVERILLAAKNLEINDLPRVWPTPLPEELYLPHLLVKAKVQLSWDFNNKKFNPVNKHDTGFIFGLKDDPTNQLQPILSFGGKSQNKHLLIYGGSGSGKSTLLRTLIMSVALSRTPSQAHIYCVDLSGEHSLRIFQSNGSSLGLPHIPNIGGVISADDKERINRLWGLINLEIEKRLSFLHQVASDLDDFNQTVPDEDRLPDIFVFIDGISKQFTDTNEGFTERLDDLLKKGGPAGIHIVISATHPGDVPEKIKTSINGLNEQIILKPADTAQVQTTFGNLPPDSFVKKVKAGQSLKPGQGVCNSNPVLELKIALPINAQQNQQLQSLSQLIQTMNFAWHGPRPKDIDILPTFIEDQELYSDKYCSEAHSVLIPEILGLLQGVENISLKALGLSLIDHGPIFQILSETAKLGKTSVLRTWLLELAEKYEPQYVKFVIFDFHVHTLKPFSKCAHTQMYVNTEADVEKAIQFLKKEIESRKKTINDGWQKDDFNVTSAINKLGYLLIVIDDLVEMCNALDEEITEELEHWFDVGKKYGVRLIITENVSQFSNSYPFVKMSNQIGCGILLGGSSGLEKFNDTKFSGAKVTTLLPGRGFLVFEKKAFLMQFATFQSKDENPESAFQTRASLLNKADFIIATDLITEETVDDSEALG